MKDRRLNPERPKQELLAGVQLLDALLNAHGFKFHLENAAKGSGGYFASGAYTRGDRRLELHFRYSLGMVTYRVGRESLDHETYMRLLGVYGRNQYPDFPQEPIDSFKHLASDLQDYCSDFIYGDGQQFRKLAERLRANPEMFKGVP